MIANNHQYKQITKALDNFYGSTKLHQVQDIRDIKYDSVIKPPNSKVNSSSRNRVSVSPSRDLTVRNNLSSRRGAKPAEKDMQGLNE